MEQFRHAKSKLIQLLENLTIEDMPHEDQPPQAGSSTCQDTTASGYTRSNKDQVFEENNHEEADTLLNHQAVLASPT